LNKDNIIYCTNYKTRITRIIKHELHELLRIHYTNY